jgi:hypothetical protein
MEEIDFDTNVTLKQAYLIMFEYLDRKWESHGKQDTLGDVLSTLSLFDSASGKIPMDGSVFPEWIDCAKKVLTDEASDTGYRNADIRLTK